MVHGALVWKQRFSTLRTPLIMTGPALRRFQVEAKYHSRGEDVQEGKYRSGQERRERRWIAPTQLTSDKYAPLVLYEARSLNYNKLLAGGDTTLFINACLSDCTGGSNASVQRIQLLTAPLTPCLDATFVCCYQKDCDFELLYQE